MLKELTKNSSDVSVIQQHLAKISDRICLSEYKYDAVYNSEHQTQEIATADLDRYIKLYENSDCAIGVCSGMKSKHLIMLDFKIGHSYKPAVIDTLSEFKQSGVLFKTTNSFYFYGNTLYDFTEWSLKMLELCGMRMPDQTPLLDLGHVMHSARRREAVLRVNQTIEKHTPTFSAQVKARVDAPVVI